MAVPDYLSKLTHGHPNLHLSATEKHLGCACSQPQLCRSHSSIRNAIFPPAGLKLSLRVANIPVLGYLWVVCGSVWHYSSFKCRILDCPTDSDFQVPHSKTASNKSKRQTAGNFTSPRQNKTLNTNLEILNNSELADDVGFFFLAATSASRYPQFQVLSHNSTTVKSTFKHTAHGTKAFHLTKGAIHEPCIGPVGQSLLINYNFSLR